MDKKTIDTIVWWIPFKKTRDAIRDYLLFVSNSLLSNKISTVDIDNIISGRLRHLELEALNETCKYLINQVNLFEDIIFNKFKENDFKISHGVFEGMKYIVESHGSSLFPKLLGCYEEQIYGWISDIKKRNYDLILDIGCAEGYYAVGFAFRGDAKKIIAYDISEKSIELITSLANANRLKSELIIQHKTCEHNEITRLSKNQKLLIFCDIEGAEYELLDPKVCPALINIDIIVEVHDAFIKNLTQTITERFQDTHQIEIVVDTDRDTKKYKQLNDFPVDTHSIIVNELRFSAIKHGGKMIWLRLIARK